MDALELALGLFLGGIALFLVIFHPGFIVLVIILLILFYYRKKFMGPIKKIMGVVLPILAFIAAALIMRGIFYLAFHS